MARRCSTRSSLSLILRGRLVRLPQTKFPRSRNLLMMPQTVLLWRPTSLAIFRYEYPFRQYPTTIPVICSITGRTIITSISCRPSLVTVVLVSREQLWLWRSRCTIRNSVQNWLELIYTKTHIALGNIPLYNVQQNIRPKPIHVEMRMN